MPVSFEDYLAGCLNRIVPVIDHSLRAERLPDGRITFYIHPANVDGDTPNFFVSRNELTNRDLAGEADHDETIERA